MSTWQTIAQLLTAGGVGAFGASLVKAIPELRKSGAETHGLEADADKTRTALQIEIVEAGREQVAFLRAELTAARAEFAVSQAEFSASLKAAREENEALGRDLAAARAEVSTLRGVVAALSHDLDATQVVMDRQLDTGE